MEGGGPWSLEPGQFTDDSELAMCLMRGLIDGKGKLNTAHICNYYGQWIAGEPFDAGNNTRNTLSEIDLDNPSALGPRLKAGTESMSNGSLMKITPLAVWC